MKRRRGRGEGTVYKRKDGLWHAAISMGLGPDGKRRRLSLYSHDKNDLLDQLARIRPSARRKLAYDLRNETAGGLIRRWLDRMPKSLEESTKALYRGVLENHALPVIGMVPVRAVSVDTLRTLFAHLEKRHVGARTRQILRRLLIVIFGNAQSVGVLESNPARELERPKTKRRKQATWSALEAATFLKAAADDPFYALFVLALTTGLRRGELLGLQWADVDLRGRSLSIHRQVTSNNGKLVVKGILKTQGSTRRVDLTPLAVGALQRHPRTSQWVFPNKTGGPMIPRNLTLRHFAPAIKAAKVPQIRFHDTRHTTATLMLMEGVNPKVVADLLGHSSVRTTLDTYSAVLPTIQREAVDRLGKVFERAKRKIGRKRP